MTEAFDGGNNMQQSILSRRMHQAFLQQERYSFNDDYIRKVYMNPYHVTDNPTGIVNLSTAFSYFCDDLMYEKFLDPALYRWNLDNLKTWHVTSTANKALHLRESFASFYSDKLKLVNLIDPRDLVVINGVTSALDYLAHCIADPNDVILIPVPAYAYLTRNIGLRAEVNFWPIDLWNCEGIHKNDGEVPFQLRPDVIEAAIKKALKSGRVVRGVLLVNPNNPLGDVYSADLIYEILKLCHRYSIHVILDEIHALCVFDENITFHSAASYSSIPDPDRTHIIWSMSKDFSFAGARIAMVYTRSKDVHKSLCRLMPFFEPPPPIQAICQRILNDRTWCNDVYFPKFLERLRMAYSTTVRRLTAIGVKVRPASSGFVVMADFGPFLKEDTFHAEKDFVSKLLQAGVYVTPGYVMHCSKPGWMRIVVSHPKDILKEGLDRIEKALTA